MLALSSTDKGQANNGLPILCGSWAKGRDTVRVQLAEYRGKALLDCRIWYSTPEGELRPSPKGITLTVDALPELASAITKAIARAKSMGLILDGVET